MFVIESAEGLYATDAGTWVEDRDMAQIFATEDEAENEIEEHNWEDCDVVEI